MNRTREGAEAASVAPVRRRARTPAGRLGIAIGIAVALVLGGSGAGWAFWSDVRPLTAAASGVTMAAPVAGCTPPANPVDGADSPVSISWSAVAVPAGATVSYLLTVVSDANVTRTFTPTAGATSFSLQANQVGSTLADKTRLQTITVTATVTFVGGAQWTLPSNVIGAQGVRYFIFGFGTNYVNMECR